MPLRDRQELLGPASSPSGLPRLLWMLVRRVPSAEVQAAAGGQEARQVSEALRPSLSCPAEVQVAALEDPRSRKAAAAALQPFSFPFGWTTGSARAIFHGIRDKDNNRQLMLTHSLFMLGFLETAIFAYPEIPAEVEPKVIAWFCRLETDPAKSTLYNQERAWR